VIVVSVSHYGSDTILITILITTYPVQSPRTNINSDTASDRLRATVE